MYHSPLIRKVINLFKQTNLNVAFKSTNTIYQQLSHKSDNTNPSGIYEIKCNTLDMAYIGHSGRPITTRHGEHTRYIRTNNPNSAYAMHILNNKHEYGTANETLKLLKPCNKGLKMNCWESFYIQLYCQRNRLIKEQLTGDYNRTTTHSTNRPTFHATSSILHNVVSTRQVPRPHSRVSPFSFTLIIVNISDSGLDNSYF